MYRLVHSVKSTLTALPYFKAVFTLLLNSEGILDEGLWVAKKRKTSMPTIWDGAEDAGY